LINENLGVTAVPIVIVMGVAGSGKSTVARLLAAELACPFAEGDAWHSPASVARMRAGHPLSEAERAPWLARIVTWLREQRGGAVVSCSALRRRHRDVLRGGGPDVRFALLSAERATLAARIEHRPGHFMPASLLDSQLATLEPLEPDERGVTFEASLTPEKLAAAIRTWLCADRADPRKPPS